MALSPGPMPPEFTDLSAYPDLLWCTGQLLSVSEDALADLRAERRRLVALHGPDAPGLGLLQVEEQIRRYETLLHDAKHALSRAYGRAL